MSERRTVTASDGPAPSPRGPEIPWGNDGSAVALSASVPARPRTTITVVGLAVSLTQAGTSSTVVELKKNGTTVATVTVAASSTYAFVELPVPVRFRARVDTYQIVVSSAGTAAVGIVGAIELAG